MKFPLAYVKKKTKIVSVYDRFKAPVDKFLSENEELLNNYSINIRAGLVVEDSLQGDIFDFINKQKKMHLEMTTINCTKQLKI